MVGMMSVGSDLYTSLRRMKVARLNFILGCHTCQNVQFWNRSSHLRACQTFILYASNRETCRGESKWSKNEQHTKYNGSINLKHPAARIHVMRSWLEMNRARLLSCENVCCCWGQRCRVLVRIEVGWQKSVGKTWKALWLLWAVLFIYISSFKFVEV